MKFTALLVYCFLLLVSPRLVQANLVIATVFDGNLNSPKGIELFVTQSLDYAGWEVDLEFNANTTFANGYTFPASSNFSAGDYIYITSTATDPILTALGMQPGKTVVDDGSFIINGNDRIRVTDGTTVIDQYGQSGVDGTGEPWEYVDSFATRKVGTTASGSFVAGDWDFNPTGTLNELDILNSPLLSTLGTFTAVPEPSAVALLGVLAAGCCGFHRLRNEWTS